MSEPYQMARDSGLWVIRGPNGSRWYLAQHETRDDAKHVTDWLNAAYAAGQAAAPTGHSAEDFGPGGSQYLKRMEDEREHYRAEARRLRAALERAIPFVEAIAKTDSLDAPFAVEMWDELRAVLAATPATVEQTGKPGVRQDFESRGSQAEKAGVSTEPVLKEPAAIGAYSAAHPSNAEDRALIERAIANMTRSNVGAPSGLSAVFLPHDQIDRLLALAEKGLDR